MLELNNFRTKINYSSRIYTHSTPDILVIHFSITQPIFLMFCDSLTRLLYIYFCLWSPCCHSTTMYHTKLGSANQCRPRPHMGVVVKIIQRWGEYWKLICQCILADPQLYRLKEPTAESVHICNARTRPNTDVTTPTQQFTTPIFLSGHGLTSWSGSYAPGHNFIWDDV